MRAIGLAILPLFIVQILFWIVGFSVKWNAKHKLVKQKKLNKEEWVNYLVEFFDKNDGKNILARLRSGSESIKIASLQSEIGILKLRIRELEGILSCSTSSTVTSVICTKPLLTTEYKPLLSEKWSNTCLLDYKKPLPNDISFPCSFNY